MFNKICCFSGYRPEKFPFNFNNDKERHKALRDRLVEAIIHAVGDGYDTFMCGMAKGFDLMAGEVVIELIQTRPAMIGLKLVAVLPFTGHGFTDKWQRLHCLVLEKAHEMVTLGDRYYPKAYMERNRYMVRRSSRIICYYTGLPGGTAFTVGLAQKNKLEVINIAVPDST